jgi:hypothetical protein
VNGKGESAMNDSKTEFFFVSAHEAKERNRAIHRRGYWKRGWYYKDEDLGREGPFFTKEDAEGELQRLRKWWLSLPEYPRAV